MGRRTRRKKGKNFGLGWDENTLTEWQREEKTATNNADKKHVQHAVFSPPNAQLTPE